LEDVIWAVLRLFGIQAAEERERRREQMMETQLRNTEMMNNKLLEFLANLNKQVVNLSQQNTSNQHFQKKPVRTPLFDQTGIWKIPSVVFKNLKQLQMHIMLHTNI
jgi:hypothetical protein